MYRYHYVFPYNQCDVALSFTVFCIIWRKQCFSVTLFQIHAGCSFFVSKCIKSSYTYLAKNPQKKEIVREKEIL
jgi:uncharacterized membrane protein YwaF